MTALDSMQHSTNACPDLQLTVVEGAYDSTLVRLLASLGATRVGFEAAHVTVSRHNWLTATLTQHAGAPQLVPLENVVEHLRLRKDEYELSMLRESARLLSGVANGVFDEVRRGRTEREVAQAIDRRLIAAGFERPAFDTIVASGPNAALPHAHPGERKLGENELVVLDFGGVYRSYCSDLTRTVFLGTASERVREVYAAVLEAHDEAIRTVGPGRSRFAIDAAARDVLGGHGLGDAFGHGTGHGLGIDIHEDPKVTRRSGDAPVAAEAEPDDAVDVGMVFTIEPGAYLPGWGGVRIEDDVLVTQHGVDVLTNVTTDLLEL
jgi:Xaa-Pro aminopeptidase